MEIQGRLEIFFARLRAAPACATAEEALALICRLIEEVEDQFCSVPRRQPPPFRFTGRMYAPQPDHIFVSAEGTIRAETRRHTMLLTPDGAIRITRTGSIELEFSKPGITV
jgi:hypothetical protein